MAEKDEEEAISLNRCPPTSWKERFGKRFDQNTTERFVKAIDIGRGFGAKRRR